MKILKYLIGSKQLSAVLILLPLILACGDIKQRVFNIPAQAGDISEAVWLAGGTWRGERGSDFGGGYTYYLTFAENGTYHYILLGRCVLEHEGRAVVKDGIFTLYPLNIKKETTQQCGLELESEFLMNNREHSYQFQIYNSDGSLLINDVKSPDELIFSSSFDRTSTPPPTID